MLEVGLIAIIAAGQHSGRRSFALSSTTLGFARMEVIASMLMGKQVMFVHLFIHYYLIKFFKYNYCDFLFSFNVVLTLILFS